MRANLVLLLLFAACPSGKQSGGSKAELTRASTRDAAVPGLTGAFPSDGGAPRRSGGESAEPRATSDGGLPHTTLADGAQHLAALGDAAPGLPTPGDPAEHRATGTGAGLPLPALGDPAEHRATGSDAGPSLPTLADAGLPLPTLGDPAEHRATGSDAGPSLPTLADAAAEDVARALLRDFAGDDAVGKRLDERLTLTAHALQKKLARVDRSDPADVARALAEQVARNLEAKRAAHFPLEPRRLERQVIDFEAFRFETFVATGVFPKRYFGYLDERWDTAEYEHRLKRVTHSAAAACNRWLESTGATFRVSEQELIVTFLAEGGAVLLREQQAELNRVHPVLGIGLDDIAKGFDDLKPLVKLMDHECGTHLETVVAIEGGQKVLSRFFTFEEALAGTAVMWVWEKQIAETKLKAKGRPGLSGRSREEQFVIASLVYNSGILFDEKTVERIARLDTGSYLADVSERSKARMWPLPVLTPKDSLKRLLGGNDYPAQGTSWSTVFHVLERYGAFMALSKFDDAFDGNGALTPAP